MNYGSAVLLARLLCLSLLGCGFGSAECPVHELMVRGRVENASVNAAVPVELVYASDKVEDSAEATAESGTFKIRVEFLTLSKRPVLMGELRRKRDRKPTKVAVTLKDRGHEDKR